MEWQEFIIELLNSPAFVTVLASIVGFLLTKLYKAKPKWKQYEGTIYTAIKMAEKAVPDNHESPAVFKLNWAIGYVIEAYEAYKDREATLKETKGIEEAVQKVFKEQDAGK